MLASTFAGQVMDCRVPIVCNLLRYFGKTQLVLKLNLLSIGMFNTKLILIYIFVDRFSRYILSDLAYT